MKVKLTDALVSRMPLPADAIDTVIWDADIVGFGLRIRLSGKTGILSYRHAGTGRSANTKRMKLAALRARPITSGRGRVTGMAVVPEGC